MVTLERILQAAANSLGQGKRVPHCNGEDRAQWVQDARSEATNFDWAKNYGESGYEDPVKGIVFANWNKFPRGLDDILERAGYAVEWSDEWIIDYESLKAYRTSPDCYSWKPYYVLTEGGDVIGGDAIENGDELDWYVNEYLLNSTRRASVFKIDFAQLGFTRFNGKYETGLHTGQNDDPKAVAKQIRAALPDHDFIFSLDSTGQFDASWSAWTRPRQEDE